MAVVPSARWCAPGSESALEEASAIGRAFARGGPASLAASLPAGWSVVRARPMRAVVACDGVFAKAHRAPTTLDRAKAALRSPRSVAEASALSALREAGVPAVEPLGWAADADADVLLLRAVPSSRTLADVVADRLSRRERTGAAEAVGRLLRAAHDAGWGGRDLHRGNVLLANGRAVLLDPGASPLRGVPGPARRALLLGVAGHGLGPDPRDALRALRAYAGGDRAAARTLFERSAPLFAWVRRTYRRGRTRRATRTGLHFETFRPAGAGSTAVRSIDSTPASWKEACARWLEADPVGARAIKDGGDVLRTHLGEHRGEVVLKFYAPTWKDRFRVPRPLRAFRTAYALRVRGVACPEPLLAASIAAGRGLHVSGWAAPFEVPSSDLHRAVRPEGGDAPSFAALSPRERRAALESLGRFLRRMHDAEVVHRDLKSPNLVAWRAGERIAFSVVDLDGARVARGPVPWTRRARDLGRLDASVPSPPVSRADRMRVVRGYFAAWARLPVTPGVFSRAVAAAAARHRERLARKRPPAARG